MIRAVFLGALAVACAFVLSLFVAVPGFSKPLQRFASECNVTMPCIGAPASYERGVRPAKSQRYAKAEFGAPITPPETQRSFLSGSSSFIRGRLICALNVGAELARRGIKGTGSATAKSYLGWGHASGPQPGAVAVFSRGKRGGHVAIVESVRPDGTVIYLNPSSRRQAWQVGPYNRRPIAFRVAG